MCKEKNETVPGMKHQLLQANRGSKMTLLLPELKYKYLHFKTPWLQPVKLSERREGDRRVGHDAGGVHI